MGERDKRAAKTYGRASPLRTVEFCNTIFPIADIRRRRVQTGFWLPVYESTP